MRKLHGQMRHYPWGSRTHLAELTGRPAPSAEPEAEIWYGAHPAEPCTLGADPNGEDEGRVLADLIAADPAQQLGARCVRQFGAELPFLLKLLAAGEPLSLQAHPSAEQAQAGFERENTLGLALDDAKRNYKDPRHKPELLVALTRFDALAGFQDPRETLGQLAQAGLLEHLPETVLLHDENFCGLVQRWLSMPVEDVARRVTAVRERNHATGAALAQRYPQDPGVLIALLLNRIVLEPGEGLFIPAGVLHAHLGGLGVEIMANSDNVLRGGLTAKHVAADELLAIVDFEPIPPERLVVGGEQRPTSIEFPALAAEFELAMYRLPAGVARSEPEADGPRILLCVEGRAEVHVRGSRERLAPGEAVWLAASDAETRIFAHVDNTTVFLASVPGRLPTHVSRGRP
ncbi:mannose-6-phosphate isomerase, class I [Segniliparus rugosus]|uniref:mannose-6-phosphate isomerase n=1 Tax=Segniliparus rugosus (strain ATCC BAA-974 / DSM 45345 / CCUG 50838 / CIP 108380 / JCM 13579 / CDC 945) TaxID=679197 RepID=E5XLE1_SEGRC|nr:mannose-6-phosphate isomerase, class I [Segniliparus rugosus]EFV14824.1 mannose-6-phosphate isomerase, class I [Segniliparus rugosus ATCC BAA-974]